MLLREKVSKIMFNMHPGFLLNSEIEKVNKFIDIYIIKLMVIMNGTDRILYRSN